MSLELKNNLLAAMPSMTDPRFHQAVIFICEYSPAEGAMGLVINDPMNLSLSEVLAHIDIDVNDPALAEQKVLVGGPLGEQQGFILSLEGDADSSDMQLSLSAAKQDLVDLANGDIAEDALVFLGYCSWRPGQLENELKQNAWLVTPASAEVLFVLPYVDRWRAAAALVGVDFNRMVTNIGHA